MQLVESAPDDRQPPDLSLTRARTAGRPDLRIVPDGHESPARMGWLGVESVHLHRELRRRRGEAIPPPRSARDALIGWRLRLAATADLVWLLHQRDQVA